MKDLLDTNISLFDGFKVRKVFYKKEWWFVLEDIIYVLTESKDPKQYIKRMRERDEELQKGWVQIVPTLDIKTKGGVQKMSCSNTAGSLRIIQSIPSPKAEPFKKWLAAMGSERIEEKNDPELGIHRSVERAYISYKNKGYDDAWIKNRLQGIAIRHKFTDELKNRGIASSLEYAILTNQVYKGSLGEDKKGISKHKGLAASDNIRDHMDDVEVSLVQLGEASSKKFMEERNAHGFDEVQSATMDGGEVAGQARKTLEDKTGKNILSDQNALSPRQKRKRK